MSADIRSITIAAGLYLIASPGLAADLDLRSSVFENGGVLARVYLRADVSFADGNTAGFRQDTVTDQGGSFLLGSLEDNEVAGGGIGYHVTDWFRIELTGEYRFGDDFGAIDYLKMPMTDPDGILSTSTLYRGGMRSAAFLANAYLDAPLFPGLTPYIGAGIGIARHTLYSTATVSTSYLTDPATGDVYHQKVAGWATEHSRTKLAWALMAGASLDISPAVKLDVGYRYIDLGGNTAASTGRLGCECGAEGTPLSISDLTAHEAHVGVRLELGPMLSRKPADPRY